MPTPQVPEGGGGCYRDLSSPEISSSSSSYVPPTKGAEGVEMEEELELGLSLGSNMAARIKCRGGGNGGCGDALEMVAVASPSPWGECCRILTAKDLPPIAGSTMALDVSTPSGDGASVRNKRGACSMAPEAGSNTPSQVVGWPPIRAYRRMNSSFNQTKDSETIQQKKPIGDTGIHGNSAAAAAAAAENHEKKEAKSLFVKVKMDGMSIGRKVDLCSHRSYDTLALALEDMFQRPAGSKAPLLRSTKVSSLLDGSSEYVLTYEDKEGDWMLVGDVPWGMFLSTVRRLRIMRTSDANGFEQSFQCSTMAGEAASPSSIRKKGK